MQGANLGVPLYVDISMMVVKSGFFLFEGPKLQKDFFFTSPHFSYYMYYLHLNEKKNENTHFDRLGLSPLKGGKKAIES